MNITVIRSDRIYKKMTQCTISERKEIYRNEIMKPFEFKFKCVGVPLKAERPGSPDVISFSIMSGGYACGYALIKHYLNKTGHNIYDATVTPTKDILKEVEDFWNGK